VTVSPTNCRGVVHSKKILVHSPKKSEKIKKNGKNPKKSTKSTKIQNIPPNQKIIEKSKKSKYFWRNLLSNSVFKSFFYL
jgi:hypothetical protein